MEENSQEIKLLYIILQNFHIQKMKQEKESCKEIKFSSEQYVMKLRTMLRAIVKPIRSLYDRSESYEKNLSKSEEKLNKSERTLKYLSVIDKIRNLHADIIKEFEDYKQKEEIVRNKKYMWNRKLSGKTTCYGW